MVLMAAGPTAKACPSPAYILLSSWPLPSRCPPSSPMLCYVAKSTSKKKKKKKIGLAAKYHVDITKSKLTATLLFQPTLVVSGEGISAMETVTHWFEGTPRTVLSSAEELSPGSHLLPALCHLCPSPLMTSLSSGSLSNSYNCTLATIIVITNHTSSLTTAHFEAHDTYQPNNAIASIVWGYKQDVPVVVFFSPNLEVRQVFYPFYTLGN